MTVESKRREVFDEVQALAKRVQRLGGVVQNPYKVPDFEIEATVQTIEDIKGELTELGKHIREYSALQQSNE